VCVAPREASSSCGVSSSTYTVSTTTAASLMRVCWRSSPRCVTVRPSLAKAEAAETIGVLVFTDSLTLERAAHLPVASLSEDGSRVYATPERPIALAPLVNTNFLVPLSFAYINGYVSLALDGTAQHKTPASDAATRVPPPMQQDAGRSDGRRGAAAASRRDGDRARQQQRRVQRRQVRRPADIARAADRVYRSNARPCHRGRGLTKQMLITNERIACSRTIIVEDQLLCEMRVACDVGSCQRGCCSGATHVLHALLVACFSVLASPVRSFVCLFVEVR